LGRVKRDLYKEVQWQNIGYDNVEAIMGLIVHRFDYDTPYTSMETALTQENYFYSENVRCVYMDLDNMIKDTKLSFKQKYIVERIMIGFTMSDIAKEFNAEKRDITNILRSAAKKIQKTYHVKLINWLETSGRVKVLPDAKYKTCAICGQTMNIRYFSPDSKSGDGYERRCRICRM
jgi:uncharacterized protein (DUF433 family)